MSNQDNPEAEPLLRRALIFECNVHHPDMSASDITELIVKVLDVAERTNTPVSTLMAHAAFPGGYIKAFKSDRGR